MDPATIALITAIVEMMLKYGAPAVISAIQTWQKDPATITAQDIKDLCSAIPEPESFFKEG